MWGKNAGDPHYHFVANDHTYLCGKRNEAVAMTLGKPLEPACSECSKRIRIAEKTLDTPEISKSRRTYTEDIIKLLLRLEYGINGCWHDDIPNYGPGGVLESVGRDFGYPIRFSRASGKSIIISNWQRSRILEAELTSQEVLSGFYQFGANKYPVIQNLDLVLMQLEQGYGLAVKSGREDHRPQLLQPIQTNMSKSRKQLLVRLAPTMCRYYSGFTLRSGRSKISEYPIRFSKDGKQFEAVPGPDPNEEILMTGCCQFGANQFHIYNKLNYILHYLEIVHGLLL